MSQDINVYNNKPLQTTKALWNADIANIFTAGRSSIVLWAEN